MDLRFWAATDVGRVRDHNEDNFLVDQNLQLFVVCDGMGGHAAGEVASAVCVRTVRDVIAAQADLLAHIGENPGDDLAGEKLRMLMRTAIQSACGRIFEMAQRDPSRRGMGTTCVALVVAGDRGFVGHVGDSRMYRLRDGNVEQVTDDHSLLNEMIRQGKVAPGTTEAEFPHKNAVTRAVGVRESVDVDAFTIDLVDGDRLLMCSDGLNEYFDESVNLLEMMGSKEPEETTARCIDFANQAGGKDNITVVVVDYGRELFDEDDAPERAEVIEILRETAYFHYLAPAELEQIRRMASRVELDADDAVVGDDEHNDKLYLILKGSVSLQLDGEQVSVLTTGEHFGEMALIDAQDEQDTNLVAQTLEPSIFLAIERDQFVELLRTAPGLAIKLLWNFVQVFADRLQSVPPEYRFTPDEWRSDPDAIADVTPPSGTLVFEEDLERSNKEAPGDTSASDADSIVPPLPGQDDDVAIEVSAGVAASEEEFARTEQWGREETDTIDPPNIPMDLRKTIGLDDVDMGEIKSPANPAAPVEINKKSKVDDGKSGVGAEQSDQGLTSGSYDQRVLESGLDNDSSPNPEVGGGANQQEDTPSVSFNRKTGADSGASGRSPTPPPDSGDNNALRETIQMDWDEDTGDLGGLNSPKSSKSAGPPALPPQPNDDGEPGKGSKQHKAGKDGSAPRDTPPGLRDSRPVPSAEVLKKASESEKSPADKDKDEQGTSTASDPKVMISSELMVDDDEST